MTTPELYLWLPVVGFVYLAVGAAVMGFLDRCDPAYDYNEWWAAGMALWPLIVVAVLLTGITFFLSAPFRWIYHRVRLLGRDRER